jgi:outer membrane lipoprotein-sorting protein
LPKKFKNTIGYKIVLAFILLSLFIISGCTFRSTKVVQEDVYTNNDRLMQQSDTFSYSNSSKNSRLEKELSLEFIMFSGVNTLWVVSSDTEQELKIDIDQQISDGKFKTIVVSDDKKTREINVLNEGSSQGMSASISIKPNTKYYIKIVGSQAKGNIKMELSSENDIHLTALE